MIARRLKNFLEQEGAQYLTIQHSVAYNASEIARVAHIHPKGFAKTLIVKADDRLAMVVLAASERLDLGRLKVATEARHVGLVPEFELERRFPGCEPGAMPPLAVGNIERA